MIMTSKNAIVSAILGMLLFFAVSCGDCSERHRRSPHSDNSSAQLDGGISFPEEYNSIQSYPYIADESYCQAVIKNIEGISIGDSYKDICLKLPSATIVRPIYGGVKYHRLKAVACLARSKRFTILPPEGGCGTYPQLKGKPSCLSSSWSRFS